MKGFLKFALTLAAGAAIGGVAVKLYYDSKYDFEEPEEIEENEPAESEGEEEVVKEEDKREYDHLLEELKYSYEPQNEPEPVIEGEGVTLYEDPPIEREEPYEITQDDFEGVDSYDSDEYTIYADDYITDSYGMPITKEEAARVLGPDIYSYFDDESVDQVYIRNDQLKMDLSVIRDLDNFTDVAPPRIRRMFDLNGGE